MSREQRIKLFHRKPINLKGDTLYPLSQLKDKYPEVYAEEIKKYTDTGREELMALDIMPLGVKWNDVIHLSPIHPDQIREALRDAGFKKDFPFDHFEIDSGDLNPENAVIFLNSGDTMQKEDFLPYTPENLEKLTALPEATREHYRDSFKEGKIPLTHLRAPHVLYKGEIKLK